jgi:hypothetical protein
MLPELGAAFVIFVLPIWVARHAKPLTVGTPYRWGVYMAFQSAGLVVLGLWDGVEYWRIGARAAAAVFAALLVVALSATIGLALRRRVGVVALLVASPFELAVPMLVHAAYPAAMIRGVDAKNAIPALAVMAVNVVYFKKRWKLLNNSDRRPPAATP